MLLKQACELEERVGTANRTLAAQQTVPETVRTVVHDLADVLADAPEEELTSIDPYLLISLDRGALAALRALGVDDPAQRRRMLRVSLEQARQALRDVVDGAPTAEQTDAKEVAGWLGRMLDVPQHDLAVLLGVSQRQWQRWVSERDPAEPRGEEARRVRVLARVAGHLRHALTGPGVVNWFQRPHPGLDGRPPRALLTDPTAAPELLRLASRARSQRAT